MKNIDIKSLIIGVLLTSTIFLGVAATSKTDKGKWDEKQRWAVADLLFVKSAKRWFLTEGSKPLAHSDTWPEGWEPIGQGKPVEGATHWLVRKREH